MLSFNSFLQFRLTCHSPTTLAYLTFNFMVAYGGILEMSVTPTYQVIGFTI